MTNFHFEDDQPRKLDMAIWRRIVGHALPYRWTLAGLGLSAALIAACEVLLPFLTGRIIDAVTRQQPGGWTLLAGGYLATMLSLCVFILVYIVLAGWISTSVCHDIRRASFAKLQELPFAYYDQRPVGWIMSRLTSDSDRLARIMGWTLMDFVWAIGMVVGITSMMVYLHWQLALFVLGVLPPLAVISMFFQRRLLHSARAIRRANAELTASYNESIMGVRTTKALVRESANLSEFQTLSGKMYDCCVTNSLQSAVYVPIVITLGSIMTGLTLWFGGRGVFEGWITLGTLVSFLNYSGLLFEPIRDMAAQLVEVQMAQASAERIEVLLSSDPAIRDSAEVIAKIDATSAQPRTMGVAIDGYPERIRSIEFDNVVFGYKEGQTVLQNFQLKVEAGETIALVGPTGGGKSTIVALLCRFYEPTGGNILIDGVDYRQRSLHWYQSSMGIVLQTPHLFSGTIRENIRYGRLDASDAEVARAAETVRADRFINQMPDGFETQVGEGGNRLSTGQKQLVSLARAILADPQIFVMDEATSSVDSETEHLIQQAIDRVLENRISFVIAHRLSTIRRATRILVIDHGRIVEMGSHAELFRRRGRYYDLYLQQFRHQRETDVLAGQSKSDDTYAAAAKETQPT